MQRNEVRTSVALARSRNEEPDFSYADLRGLDLTSLDLARCNLISADLRDADLRDALLRDAFLSGADLRGADLRRANLENAFLSEALLQGAKLRGANLKDVDLSDTDLTGVDLEGVDLSTTWDQQCEPGDDELIEATDEEWAALHIFDEPDPPPPPPPLTERERKLPALAALSPGTTLPVRLGEDVPLHRITRPFIVFTILASVVCAVIVALIVRASVTRALAGNPLDGVGIPIAGLEILGAAVLPTFFVGAILTKLIKLLLRHFRTLREEGTTIVELSTESVRPGATAQAYIEIVRHASIENLRIRLICSQAEPHKWTGNARRNVYRTMAQFTLLNAENLSLPPGTPWRKHLPVTIPRNALRHNQDPYSSRWISWQLELNIQTTRRPTITRKFPFRLRQRILRSRSECHLGGLTLSRDILRAAKNPSQTVEHPRLHNQPQPTLGALQPAPHQPGTRLRVAVAVP